MIIATIYTQQRSFVQVDWTQQNNLSTSLWDGARWILSFSSLSCVLLDSLNDYSPFINMLFFLYIKYDSYLNSRLLMWILSRKTVKVSAGLGNPEILYLHLRASCFGFWYFFLGVLFIIKRISIFNVAVGILLLVSLLFSLQLTQDILTRRWLRFLTNVKREL